MNSFVESVRSQFPQLKRTVHDKPLRWLDNAATTLKPQCVIDAIGKHYSNEVTNVHRSVHTIGEQTSARYEQTRELIRSHIGARFAEEIIFTSGTTDGINIVAQSLGLAGFAQGDEVIITEMEHHSNIVPWQMAAQRHGIVLKVAGIDDDGTLDVEHLFSLVTERTKLISCTWVSNALGTINPVEQIVAFARERNIYTLIDAAQAMATMDVSVEKLGCDFLVFSGHKMYGPTGIGVLYGRKEVLEQMQPVRGGGDMILSVTFEKTTYNRLPYRFEAGTPNIAGVIGLGAAITFLQQVDKEQKKQHVAHLAEYAAVAFAPLEGIRLIGTSPHKAPIVSFVMDAAHPHDIGTMLDQYAIAVRVGHHCSQPVMKRFSIPATTRASFTFYNTVEEIDELVEAVKKIRKTFL